MMFYQYHAMAQVVTVSVMASLMVWFLVLNLDVRFDICEVYVFTIYKHLERLVGLTIIYYL